MPRIGFSAAFFHADSTRKVFKGKTLAYVEQSIAHWVQSLGALTYLIPSPLSLSSENISPYAEDLDGLILQGGSDVSPLSYGETALNQEWSGDKIRDDYEIALVRAFQKAGKPILGICRGLQLINVAFGGTLYQDISSQVQGSLVHRNWDIYDLNRHSITIKENSLLSKWYGGIKTATVNSVHHQGINKLGSELVVEAESSPDKMIEAFRHTGPTWIYAVQWHPEFQADKNYLNNKPLLKKFLEAANVKNRQSGN